jgi:prefoldin subunit 5
MNKEQKAIVDKLYSGLEEIKSEVEALQSAQQEALEGLSERAQEGPKGEALQTSIDYLESAVNGLDDVMTNLEEAKGSE